MRCGSRRPTPRWPDGKPRLARSPAKRGSGMAAALQPTPIPRFNPGPRPYLMTDAPKQWNLTPDANLRAAHASSRPLMVWRSGHARPPTRLHHGCRRTPYFQGDTHGPERPSHRSCSDLLRALYRPLGRRHSRGRYRRVQRTHVDRPRTGSHTEKLHLIEKFTRTDMNTMTYELTVDDPGLTLRHGRGRPRCASLQILSYLSLSARTITFAPELLVGTRSLWIAAARLFRKSGGKD